MKRIQEFIKNLGAEAKDAFKKFPITMCLVMLWTITLVLEDFTFFRYWDKKIISQFLGFFMFGSFLVETIERSRIKRKLLFELIPGILSAVFVFFLYQEISFYEAITYPVDKITWGGIHRYVAGYCALTILLAVYIWYRRSHIPWETYCLKVLQQIGRATLIFVLIGAGCAFLMGIFRYLILDGLDVGLISKFEILVFGFFYLPSLALSVQDMSEDISKLTIRIVKFVFLPINFAGAVIMYLYIVKLLIPFTIPSNQIFRMLAVLFLGGMMVWTLIGHFQEETLFMKIADKLPYLFLPLLILQGYTLGIRLAIYGITPNRYLGLMLMIFEFLYYCVYRMHRENIGIMIIVAGIMVVIATYIPGINMMDVSINNQKDILAQVNEEHIEEAPTEVWDRIYGAYIWLAAQPECQNELEKYYGEDTIAQIKQNSSLVYGSKDGKIDVYGNNMITGMDITEYSSAEVYYAEAVRDVDVQKVVLEKVEKSKDHAVKKVFNFEPLFLEYMQYEEEIGYASNAKMNAYIREHNKIQLSDTQVFYLDALSFSFDSNTKNILQYKIKGYLLEK